MKAREAIRVLAELSEAQWGLLTSAQARARGVSHMNLSRLSESGDLLRLSHGVYRDAGSPSAQHEELRAAWLAADPEKLAHERLKERPGAVVVSGESASSLHAIGDLRATRSEFTTPARKQTQRSDVRYRVRTLSDQDITVREGLPTTTRERTIADLVEDRNDLSIVGGVLRDAARQSELDIDYLIALLSPLAERNGHRKGDGEAMLEELMQIAGVDDESIARQITTMPSLNGRIAAAYLRNLPAIDTSALKAFMEHLERPLKIDAAVLAALAKQIETRPKIDTTAWAPIAKQLTERGDLARQLSAANWTALAQATHPAKKENRPDD